MSPPEINDIVDDNLASDFDGSLSGLGVDIHAASFSMSEALNALPNLSISSSHIFKQEVGGGGVTSPTHHHHGGHHLCPPEDCFPVPQYISESVSTFEDRFHRGMLEDRAR